MFPNPFFYGGTLTTPVYENPVHVQKKLGREAQFIRNSVTTKQESL
jgi:hypothetical protein